MNIIVSKGSRYDPVVSCPFNDSEWKTCSACQDEELECPLWIEDGLDGDMEWQIAPCCPLRSGAITVSLSLEDE